MNIVNRIQLAMIPKVVKLSHSDACHTKGIQWADCALIFLPILNTFHFHAGGAYAGLQEYSHHLGHNESWICEGSP